MKNIFVAALALSLSAVSGVALADGSPELNRPFGGGFYYDSRPVSNSVAAAPVASDNDAVSALQADGYRAISDLTRGSDGVWHGTAIRGAAKVNVTVAPDGHVYAR